MASNTGPIFRQQKQHTGNSTSPFRCKECGLSLNSAESLDVHLQYHKENLLKHWAVQAASSQHAEETNNNNMTKANNIKREFNPNNTIAAADSSDMQKKSPEYKSSTPENIYGHPPTPQSYQSASSPYQIHDNPAFSPNFQNFQIKNEVGSPSSQQMQFQSTAFVNFSDNFYTVEPNQQYSQDVNINKAILHHNSYRFMPYPSQSQNSPYERSKSQAQVPSSSPAYPPQPTPSPSPKQCDKCGFVCESASQLIEHINLTHPPTPAHPSYSHNNFMFEQSQIKVEEDASQSEILDLDSQKVVHQVFPEDEKRPNGDPTPHSVSTMLNSWPQQQQEISLSQQQNMFRQDQHNMFINSNEQKIFPNIPNNIPESKMFSLEQKLFQPHQMNGQNFNNNGVTSTNQEIGGNAINSIGQPQQSYRPFEHLPSQPAPVISSTQVNQVPTNGTQASGPPPSGKSSNWKSNEARRPKTYNCTACNKWFTSSGHLKRHYNTTLHKNAVKSSGQPDPAALPISAHHHPAREPSSKQDERSQSNSPREDSRGEDTNSMSAQLERVNPMPGLLQQPPNGPYDRQQPPHMHHSPMTHHPIPLGNASPLGNPNFPNMTNGSPPNGEAGLSPNTIDSRGLLSLSSSPHHTMTSIPHGYNMMPHHNQSLVVHPMENSPFQIYPNESAPHVTAATDISRPSTTGKFQFSTASINNDSSLVQQNNQPLPGFAQIQAHRYDLLSYGIANVGGGGAVTTPYLYVTDQFDGVGDQQGIFPYNEDGYKYMIVVDPPPDENVYSPGTGNNNNNEELSMMSDGDTPTMGLNESDNLGDKPDYEESTSPLVTSTVPSNDKIIKCDECDKTFFKRCYRTQHNKTFHSGVKPFKCGRCGKRFSSEEAYKEHTPKHAGDKPHKCDMCPKQFNHKTDLRRHMCWHSDEKPYSCETCGKGFIRKDHMVKHMDTHLKKLKPKDNASRG